jgi:putative hydroxymethylpyrimidine transport system substrate-binding protein
MRRACVLALALAAVMALGEPARAADRLVVVLDWLVNPDQAPLFVAQHIGAFARRGLELEVIAPTEAATPPLMVAAGRADIAITYQPQLYIIHDQGLPLMRFATLVDRPLDSIIAPMDGPVRGLGDLRGRRLGFAVPGVEQAVARAMLTHAHVDPDQVRMVDVNFQIVSALLAGRVDATISAYRNKEPHELAQHGVRTIAFYPEAYGVPTYDELIFVARRDRAGDPRLARFTAAVAEGAAYLRAHPKESWLGFIHDHPDQDTPLTQIEWDDTAARFAADPGRLDRDRYARFGQFMAHAGLIKRAPAVDEIAVSTAAP